MFKHLQSSKCLRLYKIISAKYCHTVPPDNRSTERTFKNEMTERFAEAKRSILIETPFIGYNHMVDYCARFGNMSNIFWHETTTKSYYLIEYSSLASLNHFLSKSLDLSSNSVTSRFLKFHRTATPSKKRNVLNRTWKPEQNTSDTTKVMKNMSSFSDTDDQIMALYNRNSISDLSTRLRFLTALQIEEAVSAFFPKLRVIPFGSSVNGFGRMQSDLDMLVYDAPNSGENEIRVLKKLQSNRKYDSKYLDDKVNLQLLGQIMKGWMPGIEAVDPILNARVPIIKFQQSYTGFDCDLSMGNISGHQMSDLFYTLGVSDRRVRPLVFYIRRWAEECEVIHGKQPSPNITNYMLTCMVIFFLQRLKEPILPPAKTFSSKLSKPNLSSFYIMSKNDFVSVNDSSLHTLLVDFFTFYSTFDFDRNGLCIADGRIKSNLNRNSIYIYNPLERQVNVCRNVIDFERDKFMEKCKLALNSLVAEKLNAVQLLQSYRNTDQEPVDSAKKGTVDDFVSSISEEQHAEKSLAKKIS